MKVLITGAKGTIGRVLIRGLAHEVTLFDLPENDARSLDQLTRAATGQDAIVHLAWNTTVENFQSGTIDPDNALMTYNAYRAAELATVRRVIMASSVHADEFDVREGPRTHRAVPIPDSPYGASKVFMEALGRYFAGRGLEVVCVRFGGVKDPHEVGGTGGWRRTTFAHDDCVALVDACLTAPEVPSGHAIVYGVSAAGTELFDLANPFGWTPRVPLRFDDPLLERLRRRARSLAGRFRHR